MSGFSIEQVLANCELNESRFLKLLDELISESKYLQNNPSQGLTPREDLASEHVLEALNVHSKENGGPLEVKVKTPLILVLKF